MRPQTGETDSLNVRLLKAAKDDLQDVVRMAERIWRHHFPGIISGEQIDYMLQKFYSLEVMTEEIERGRVQYCFILHDGDRVGFCAFGPVERPEEMRIHKLYVLPQFQRHGFGSRALRCIEEECRKSRCSMLTLAVNKRNSGAIHAYTCRGFAIQESVKEDIGEGFFMDDYIMNKKLV